MRLEVFRSSESRQAGIMSTVKSVRSLTRTCSVDINILFATRSFASTGTWMLNFGDLRVMERLQITWNLCGRSAVNRLECLQDWVAPVSRSFLDPYTFEELIPPKWAVPTAGFRSRAVPWTSKVWNVISNPPPWRVVLCHCGLQAAVSKVS